MVLTKIFSFYEQFRSCKIYRKCKKQKQKQKRRDTILITAEKRRNYLASEPNDQSTKFFTENVMAIEIKKKTLKCL